MQKKIPREKRKTRVRIKIKGTAKRPRLSVFRSNKKIYAQLIDDEARKTLIAASEKEIKSKTKQTRTEKAKLVGEILARKALKKKIKQVVFDRGSYRYHGRVKTLAEGVRKGGLEF